jgi:large subunit ribosomal protein L3
MHSYPARVFKNMRMPGHMGHQKVTVQNIKVLDVKEDQNLILLRGGIPGGPKGWVLIREASKKASVSSSV